MQHSGEAMVVDLKSTLSLLLILGCPINLGFMHYLKSMLFCRNPSLWKGILFPKAEVL